MHVKISIFKNYVNEWKDVIWNISYFINNLYVSDSKLFAFRGGLDKPKNTYVRNVMWKSVIYKYATSISLRLVLIVPNNNLRLWIWIFIWKNYFLNDMALCTTVRFKLLVQYCAYDIARKYFLPLWIKT